MRDEKCLDIVEKTIYKLSDKITNLEKENAELKKKNKIYFDASIRSACDIAIFRNKNAELKAENEDRKEVGDEQLAHWVDTLDELNKTKAELEKYKKGFFKLLTDIIDGEECDTCIFKEECSRQSKKECELNYLNHYLEGKK